MLPGFHSEKLPRGSKSGTLIGLGGDVTHARGVRGHAPPQNRTSEITSGAFSRKFTCVHVAFALTNLYGPIHTLTEPLVSCPDPPLVMSETGLESWKMRDYQVAHPMCSLMEKSFDNIKAILGSNYGKSATPLDGLKHILSSTKKAHFYHALRTWQEIFLAS